MPVPREISADQLRETITPWVPRGFEHEEVVAGVELSLAPRSERTLPVVKNPFKGNVVYAWSEDDASATKLALELLSQLGQGLLAGPTALINVGLGIKDVVCFLVDLQRHSVRLTDPLQINLLMLLREADGGLTAEQLRARFRSKEEAPSPAKIETALEALKHADSKAGSKALVRADQMIWKSLV